MEGQYIEMSSERALKCFRMKILRLSQKWALFEGENLSKYFFNFELDC